MKTLLKIFGILLLLGAVATIFQDDSTTSSSSKKETKKVVKKKALVVNKDKEKIKELNKMDCVEVIRCLSPADVAKEAGKSEMWAIRNYQVTVWEKPTHLGKGKRVGDMRCGSRAMILDKSGEDYKIISPLDKSIGWVNEVQLAGTSFQHPITREQCKN